MKDQLYQPDGTPIRRVERDRAKVWFCAGQTGSFDPGGRPGCLHNGKLFSGPVHLPRAPAKRRCIGIESTIDEVTSIAKARPSVCCDAAKASRQATW